MAARPPAYSEEAALSLTMAVVGSSPGPLLLLDGALNIIAASASFSEAFDVDPGAATGRPLFSLGGGEWDIPQLRSLLTATLSGAARIEDYEMDFERPDGQVRRLVVHAQRLVYLDLHNHRLLMAVNDVTDARADTRLKDEALQQNLILLQEVRHRVANSLQIIASVLLQNAKRTGSDETRGHLRDAHHRVLSVASLERQLSLSGETSVDLQAYFTELCGSIAASMIVDRNRTKLMVTVAGEPVEARVSVSLGLIVTELVINAVKHAFPDDRPGQIFVDCTVRRPNWTLSVTDDGVGMPVDPAKVEVGLGTSIVEALAKQLDAVVTVSPGQPGTRVTIAHTRISLVDRQDERAEPPLFTRPAA